MCCFSYTLIANNQQRNEENNSIHSCIQIIKYLEINLMKEEKDLYSKKKKKTLKK